MSKIHIGGIPFSADQASFMEFVEEKVGKIQEINWIVNRNTNEFRGFAFVTFENESDCFQAILTLNNMEYSGRMLRVSEASPMKTR